MFDKKYDHTQAELEAQQLWAKQDTYKASNNPGTLYSVDTPPPTISGSLHIGHVFSYTQTDIIARFKRMSGFSVFYPFGFDDNGLPTEKFVEKKNDVTAYSMSRSAFIDLCLKETQEVEKKFEQLWRQIGLSVDWSLQYSTIESRTRKISQASFIELYKKGYIYRKNEPALYCTTCRTTVAQAELDDAEKPSIFNDIVFEDCNGTPLLIATTRPELLSSCVAVFYHPSDTRYQHLAGTLAKVPVYENLVPVLADEDVDPLKGTGLVMCCTFGDKMDIGWYKKYNLPYRQSIGLDGKWVESTGPLAGMRVATARETIINILKEKGLLVAQKSIMHRVHIHERCKKEIEYLVLPQWFLKILSYKQEFLAAADTIEWYPSFMKARYKNWVENISWDWCLSRQRFFGIPFPAWHCEKCDEVILADQKDLPIDPQETSFTGSCPKCHSTNIRPDTDVMDTWNTSSLTPYICKSMLTGNADTVFENSKDEFMPMSMRPQAHDIIRTWAFYTIVKSWMHNKTIPWKNIIISGHVLSTGKEKISKSQGNSPLSPESLLSAYPADAIRYWTAAGSLGYDIAFSETQIGIGQKLIVKLWNAFKFTHTYTENYTPNQSVEVKGTVNEWLLTKSTDCYKQYSKYFEQNEFGLALQTIEKFFWADFCDNYLELIKDQLTNQENYSNQEVTATISTLYHTGLRILQLYAPFVPHITETLYQYLYQKNVGTASIHQTQFTVIQVPYNHAESSETIESVIGLVEQVRKLKSEQQLSLRTELEKLTVVSGDAALLKKINSEKKLILGITKAVHLECIQGTDSTHIVVENDRYVATVVI